ncbi:MULTISPECIES: hypothetical protein [unclassified Pseudomonas]|uniref:hypothetical protein n=1 Tax=unclassified Pseudomonas TaxID=196821 RepID=UPI0011A6F9F3|nr:MULTISPECIES: hypothetical protein [unclassified Pseudomonas]
MIALSARMSLWHYLVLRVPNPYTNKKVYHSHRDAPTEMFLYAFKRLSLTTSLSQIEPSAMRKDRSIYVMPANTPCSDWQASTDAVGELSGRLPAR